MKTISTVLSLPILKSGDDLQHQLENARTQTEGMVQYAETLQAASDRVTEVALALDQKPDIAIEGNCHLIEITGAHDVLMPLVDAGLLSLPEVDEPEDEGANDAGQPVVGA
jgi:hypothetical protein